MPGTGDLLMNTRQKSLTYWSLLKPLKHTEDPPFFFKLKPHFLFKSGIGNVGKFLNIWFL